MQNAGTGTDDGWKFLDRWKRDSKLSFAWITLNCYHSVAELHQHCLPGMPVTHRKDVSGKALNFSVNDISLLSRQAATSHQSRTKWSFVRTGAPFAMAKILINALLESRSPGSMRLFQVRDGTQGEWGKIKSHNLPFQKDETTPTVHWI